MKQIVKWFKSITMRHSIVHVWIVKAHETWWRHQMETFSALLALGEGNPPVTGGFPSQRPVTRSFGVFFDLRLNKRVSKQSRRWWVETTSRSLWRHYNGMNCQSTKHTNNSSVRRAWHRSPDPVTDCHSAMSRTRGRCRFSCSSIHYR